MEDQYGSDFITISDEDGTDYELEVLTSIEYNGCTYMAAMPADDEMVPEIIILKSVEEDGETILYVVEDETELDSVNSLIMESMFADSETD